jgi:aminopeptidase N
MRFLLMVAMLGGWIGQAFAHEDPDSYANFNQVRSKELMLNLTVDFTRQRLSGYVEHELVWLDSAARRITLDSKDLEISKVEFLDAEQHWQAAAYLIGVGDALRGQPLRIQFPAQIKKVRVHYATKPSASALQWLSAAQSTEKKQPFLYTQSQAIHARSWIPLQDTPAVRVSYKANILIPSYLKAVMSADLVQSMPEKGQYQFQMDQPVPSYLIALAVGDLQFKPIDSRSGVYGESAWLDEAVREFADVSKLVDAANQLYGQFAWGRYDLLVLPSSFPFGGMEYPRIAFVTPTVLTGDRSLVNMVAHEMAHAWAGNLVTNANWQHLWLNEGMTSYVENRLMAKVYGQKRADQELALNVAELQKEIQSLPPAETRLWTPWHGRDPEKAFNQVAYTKGQLFLRWLANQAGIDEFDLYLRGYFQRHAFQSLDSEQFLDDLQKNLIQPKELPITQAQLQEWMQGEGVPVFAVLPPVDTFSHVDDVMQIWLSQQLPLSTLKTREWSVQEWIYFLRRLPRQLSEAQLAELESNYGFSSSQNAELFTEWALLVVPLRHPLIDEPLKKFLKSVGRVRYLEPLYRMLSTNEQKREWMRKVYREARSSYHPQAQLILDQIAL